MKKRASVAKSALETSSASARPVDGLVDLVRRARHGRAAAIEVHEDHRELWVDVRFSLAPLEARSNFVTHLSCAAGRPALRRAVP